jgi:hypothetical protein
VHRTIRICTLIIINPGPRVGHLKGEDAGAQEQVRFFGHYSSQAISGTVLVELCEGSKHHQHEG